MGRPPLTSNPPKEVPYEDQRGDFPVPNLSAVQSSEKDPPELSADAQPVQGPVWGNGI